MGNKQSGPNQDNKQADVPPPAAPVPQKKEFIADNAFRKADDEHFSRITKKSDNAKISKALTFDDRKLLSNRARQEAVPEMERFAEPSGPSLQRATTFVGKINKLERKNSLQLSDVQYRRHFGREEEETCKNVRGRALSHAVEFEDLVRSRSVSMVSAGAATAPAATIEKRNECIVVVDCFSTGAVVAYRAFLMGFHVVCVSSADLGSLVDMVPDGLDFSYSATFTRDESKSTTESLDKLVSELSGLDWTVKAVVPGAETGVELADELSSRMNLRTNGTSQSTARRNKYVMGETVRNAGVRAVRQLEVKTWNQIQEFIDEWRPDPFKVIAKPMDSAGSEDVTLCKSIEELQAAFGKILGKRNGLGLINQSVLIQEYLEGIEYVVDMVSKDGEHKLTGLWQYDRAPANGASFVCHGLRLLLVSDDPDKYDRIVEYQKKVITALGIMNGPSHGEVKWFKEEPVLVEVGARCHGGDGLWVNIAEESVGVSQVQSTVDVYLSPPEVFDSMPAVQTTRQAFAGQKFLVSYQEGTLVKINPAAVAEIKAMSSYRGHQFFIKAGKEIKKTTNCFSWAGCVNLCNPDLDVLNVHYSRLEELQKSGLFEVEEAVIKAKQFVGVVDPFSTGANLASEIYKLGFSILAVYSGGMDKLGNLQTLVPQGVKLEFEGIVDFKEDAADMVKDLQSRGEIVAVVAGAETGVELADQLSHLMCLRSNGIENGAARRNKYIMGETVRAAGIRAVRQLQAQDWDSVAAFIADWNPDPFEVICKPMDSAGSEDVTLCRSIEEVEVAFKRILGKKNGLGLINHSVLVQEFLSGTEYVVDMVSRDGVHKVIALWEYDRRPANGASFVLHGQKLCLVPEDSDRYTQIIEYQKKVVTALRIMNGPSHGEVKWFKGEPVLVEVGARCHGAEGAWMEVADATLKTNQVVAAVASYMSQDSFNALPDAPVTRYGDGRLQLLVVRKSGVLAEIDADAVEELRQLKSFIRMELFLKPGDKVLPTINCFTFGGMVILVNPDTEQLLADYARIEAMDLFVLES